MSSKWFNRSGPPAIDTGRHGVYYGWVIVLVAFVCNFMGTGTGFYIFNAFIEPLCEARGWTRAQVNIAPMLGYILALFGVLGYGTLVVRMGPRIILAASSVVTAISFFLLGISESIMSFYAAFMLLFLGMNGMSGIVTSTAVNNWFVLRRGNALGVATAGVSLSGVIMPAIALSIIESRGLGSAFLWISIAILFVAPLAWIFVRTRPEDHGLLPDGASHDRGRVFDDDPFRNGASPALAASRDHADHWTLPMAVRSGAFWKIGFAYGLSMASVLGVMFQLKPRFTDVGFESHTAMNLMAATAMAGAAGKYAWAYLCDRFSARRVVMALFACNAAGLTLTLAPPSTASVLVFVALYGFSMGGVVSTQPVIIAEYFGRDAFPSIARYIGILIGINFIGYPMMGASFEATGSYDAAYGIFILLNAVSALLVTSLKFPSRRVARHHAQHSA